MIKPHHRPGSHQRKLAIPREKRGKKGRGKKIKKALHFCGFVDVAEAKEKDMRMVESEKARGNQHSCLVLFLLIRMR